MVTDSGITVYTNRDFNGNPITLAEGQHDYYKITDQLKINDRVQSIRIPPGFTVTVWEHNFKGKSTTFKADTPYVGDEFSSLISSITVRYDKNEAEAAKKYFSAMQFDGLTSIISANQPLLNDMTAFTLEGWVKASSISKVFHGFFGQNNLIELGFKNQKTTAFALNRDFATNSSYPLQEWLHVALVGDGQKLQFFHNSALIFTVDVVANGYTNGYGATTSPFNIGGNV